MRKQEADHGEEESGEQKRENEGEFRDVQSWAVPKILYLNPVHATDEEKGGGFIQLIGD